jgi:tRNA 2-selenouridine synthase
VFSGAFSDTAQNLGIPLVFLLHPKRGEITVHHSDDLGQRILYLIHAWNAPCRNFGTASMRHAIPTASTEVMPSHTGSPKCFRWCWAALRIPSHVLRSLLIEDFLIAMRSTPVVDVRSPGEHGHGHIPGAHSLPLFSDEERAVVGTLYKQQGRDAAVLEGLRIVGPKMASIVEQARAWAPDGRIAVHCWRGGERSGSVAWLLDKAGSTEVTTLRGGYKSFRNHVLASFKRPFHLAVLGGYTGTGKTETLKHLTELGEQVLDLEALAHHKGSSYGALGEALQPSTEQFENLIWDTLERMDHARPIWVEDESMMIGRARIPDAFFARMRSAVLHFADMPIEERADRLVVDYGRYPVEQLAEATKRIERRLGPQHCKAAMEALAAGDLRTVALITLRYYDKAYLRGTEKRDPQRVTQLPASANDLRGLAQRLKDHVASSSPVR